MRPVGRFTGRFLVIAIAVALAYRVLLLATISSRAHCDEAVVGVMARHILERGERPRFFYGQSYGGGGALEAYAAAALFAVFGESAALLKATPLLFSLAAIVPTYALAGAIAGRLGARLAVLFLLLAPPTLEWSVAARGGYAETIFFSVFLPWLALPALRGGRDRGMAPARWFALGAAGGFALYVFGLIAPTLVTLAILLAPSRPPVRRALLPLAVGFLVGAAVIVHENLVHGFVNVRHLVTPGGAESVGARIATFGARLIALATHDLPAFFTPWIDDFVPRIPIEAWTLFGATVALSAVQVVATRRAWRAWARSAQVDAPEPALVLLPTLHCTVYFVLYAGSRFGGLTPRYLLALYPMLAILAAAGAARLIRRGEAAADRPLPVPATGAAPRAATRRPRQLLGAALAGLLVLVGLAVAATLPRPSEIREYGVVSRGASVPLLLEHLRRERIDLVFATPPIKWKVLWEGRESVLAATYFFAQEDWWRFSEYERTAVDRAVFQGHPAAFVVHKEFAFERSWGSSDVRSLLDSRESFEGALAARGVAFRRAEVGDYAVYWDMSKNVPRLLMGREHYVKGRYFVANDRPSEAIAELEWARALDPEDPAIETLLAEARERLGRRGPEGAGAR